MAGSTFTIGEGPAAVAVQPAPMAPPPPSAPAAAETASGPVQASRGRTISLMDTVSLDWEPNDEFYHALTGNRSAG